MAAKPDPRAAPSSPRARVEAALARLPTYYTAGDLYDALGADDLVDAYAAGWLPPVARLALEERPERLLCWLVARLVRLHERDRRAEG